MRLKILAFLATTTTTTTTTTTPVAISGPSGTDNIQTIYRQYTDNIANTILVKIGIMVNNGKHNSGKIILIVRIALHFFRMCTN